MSDSAKYIIIWYQSTRSFLTFCTLRLIRTVWTLVFSITYHRLWDAASISAGKLSRFAFSYRENQQSETVAAETDWTPCQETVHTTVLLVCVVSTVIEPVTLPELWFAAVVVTPQLRRLTLWNAKAVCETAGPQEQQEVSCSWQTSFDLLFCQKQPAHTGDSLQLSSSLPSPQSSQPSHCRVVLIHRLLEHWNLPGHAVQNNIFYKTLSTDTHTSMGPILPWNTSYDWSGRRPRTQRRNPGKRGMRLSQTWRS